MSNVLGSDLYFELISNNPNARTTNQNLYAASAGIAIHPICIITESNTRITAIIFKIDLVLLLIV